MKKYLLTLVAAVASLFSASALPLGIFDHVGVGLGVGLNGISIEASTPITRFVQMRAGLSIMPGINFGVDCDVDYTHPMGYPATEEIRINGSLKRVQGEVIFNVYPIPVTSFYVAAGAYFGGPTMVGITGHTDNPDLMGQNVEIGDYELPIDKNGNVDGGIKVNGFRPYLGIGWGRAVPGKLLNFGVELGVQFHGSPKIYYVGANGQHEDLIKDAALDDDDTFQKIMDKLKVYPNLCLRLNFRAF